MKMSCQLRCCATVSLTKFRRLPNAAMIKGSEIILRNEIYFFAYAGIANGNGIFRNQTGNGCNNVRATIVAMFERHIFITMAITFVFMVIGHIMFP